jgi:hypothetical protein
MGSTAQPAGFRECDDQYAGSLYNGNDSVTIVAVEIAIATVVNGKNSSTSYSIPMTVSPKTVKDFRFNIISGDVDAPYTWQLVSGKGF